VRSGGELRVDSEAGARGTGGLSSSLIAGVHEDIIICVIASAAAVTPPPI
jgi:hypothetical protein